MSSKVSERLMLGLANGGFPRLDATSMSTLQNQ
jgi:hypothetical protein